MSWIILGIMLYFAVSFMIVWFFRAVRAAWQRSRIKEEKKVPYDWPENLPSSK